MGRSVMTLHPVLMCGGFPSKPFSNTSWYPTVLTLSAWGEHQIPWGRVHSSKTQDSHPSTSDAICKSCPTDYRLEDPTTPSLDYFNFLEHHTELREILYLMDYHFTINGYNSGTDRWTRWDSEVWERARSFHGLIAKKLQGFSNCVPGCGQSPNRYFLL